MNPPHGDLILFGVSIASPYFDILGLKFDSKLTFEDHVRGIVSRVSQRIGILRLVKRIFVATGHWPPLCYFVAILHLFSQTLNIVLQCVGWLPNVTFSFLSERCIRLPGFVLMRISCRCVIAVMLPDGVCCRRLNWTLITTVQRASICFYTSST